MAITQVSNSLVKQDLTISGGTVDNTVIGSGTPAAGTFTTVAGTLASTVTGTTAAASDNSTKIATTAYVTTAIANLVDTAPSALNTLNELAAALGDDANFATTVNSSIAAKLPLAGGTMTGDLILGDNVKLEIGSASGGDLQIYHDGSASRIVDAGTGSLKIQAENFAVNNVGDTENMITAVPDGAVSLFHNGSTKLTTTSTGIDVTGSVTADGLDVELDDNAASPVTMQQGGNSYFKIVTTNSSESIQLGNTTTKPDILLGDGNVGIGIAAPTKKLTVFGTGAGNATVQIEGEGGADPYINFLANNTQHWSLGVDDSDSDKFKISEHSALGTNDYFTVDTAGNVLVSKNSTSVSVAGVVISDTQGVRSTVDGNVPLLLNRLTDDGNLIDFRKSGTVVGSIAADSGSLAINARNTGVLLFQSGGAEKMRIDSSGNVGIGTTSVIGKVHANDSGGATVTLTRTSGATSGNLGKLRFGNTDIDSDLASIVAIQDGATNNSAITFGTQTAGAAVAERLRIDSSGNVGIGTDSPTGKLTIRKTVTGSNDQEMLTIRRDGGSSSDGARQASIAFFDGANNTYTGKISGYRDNPAGNYDGGLRFYVNPHATNANATFAELNNTPAMYLNPNRTITTFGDIFMPSGSGINFAATSNSVSNMTSELLDDYEEGTWTPSFNCTGATFNHDTQTGRYTKVGNKVSFTCLIGTDGVTGSYASNAVTIVGLPFASNNSYSGSTGLSYSWGSSVANAHWQIGTGDSFIYLYQTNNGASFVTGSFLGTGGNKNRLWITGHYYTDS